MHFVPLGKQLYLRSQQNLFVIMHRYCMHCIAYVWVDVYMQIYTCVGYGGCRRAYTHTDTVWVLLCILLRLVRGLPALCCWINWLIDWKWRQSMSVWGWWWRHHFKMAATYIDNGCANKYWQRIVGTAYVFTVAVDGSKLQQRHR